MGRLSAASFLDNLGIASSVYILSNIYRNPNVYRILSYSFKRNKLIVL